MRLVVVVIEYSQCQSRIRGSVHHLFLPKGLIFLIRFLVEPRSCVTTLIFITQNVKSLEVDKIFCSFILSFADNSKQYSCTSGCSLHSEFSATGTCSFSLALGYNTEIILFMFTLLVSCIEHFFQAAT